MIENKIEFKFFFNKFNLLKKCDKNNKIFVSNNEYLNNVVNTLGSSSYRKGLFRIYGESEIEENTKSVEEAFPNARDEIICFGRDWLNRQFAIRKKDSDKIFRFDVVYNETIHILVDLKVFFEKEVLEHTNSLFSETYFHEWKTKNKGLTLACNQCVDFKILPSLGGKDIVENLEITDSSVAWYMNLQLRSKD